MTSKEARLIVLLMHARRLHNQTVRDTTEVDCWHRAVDRVLAEHGDPEPDQRWDDPARVEHRELVERLSRRK